MYTYSYYKILKYHFFRYIAKNIYQHDTHALSVCPFKFLHQIDQYLDARLRHGIVDRGSESADRTVTLDARDAIGFGEIHEGFFLGRIFHDKAHIHS